MRYRFFLIAVFVALSTSTCAQGTPDLQERKERIKSIETSATADALKRKGRSDARLASEGVPVNKSLPAIEDIGEMKRRSKDEVAWRAMALLAVAVKGEGLDQATVDKLVEDYRLKDHFSPEEAAFISQTSPSDHDRVQFSWRYETAWTLLWALGYVDDLSKPTAVCDVSRAVKIMQERSAEQFIADAKLRSAEEIAEQADLIYRYHWAVVDARINDKPAPAGLEPGVTMERHYALNWLIGYLGQEWDEISTDT